MHIEISYIVKIIYYPILPEKPITTSFWEYDNLNDALDQYKTCKDDHHQVALYTCFLTGEKGEIL